MLAISAFLPRPRNQFGDVFLQIIIRAVVLVIEHYQGDVFRRVIAQFKIHAFGNSAVTKRKNIALILEFKTVAVIKLGIGDAGFGGRHRS